jgi:CHAT domain-containing protein/tetratricopeptide (TPR) repeat protein
VRRAGGPEVKRWPSATGGRPCLAIAAAVLLGCAPTLQKQDVDRAAAQARAGAHADAEGSLRALLARKNPPLSPAEALVVRGNLIPILESQGRLGEAIQLSQEVHSEWVAQRGERSPNAIGALANLGRLYAAVGRLNQAVVAQERSTRLAIEVHGSWHENSISARNNLASTYLRLRRHGDAIRLQEAALSASRRLSGENSLQTLIALTNLSRSYLAAGRHAEALDASAKAMSGLAALQGGQSPYTLLAAADNAKALAASGHSTPALEALTRLVAASRGTWGSRHPFTIEQMGNLARLHVDRGQPNEAMALSVAYVEGAEAVRSQPGISQEDRRALFASLSDDYRLFSGLHGRSGRLAEGFRLSELSKARTLLESLSSQLASNSAHIPPEEKEKLAELERALQAGERQVMEAADAGARLSLTAQRDALLRTYQARLGELDARFPKFAQLRSPPPMDASRLEGVVPAGSAFASYVVRGDNAVAWIVLPDGRLRFLDLGVIPSLSGSVEVLRLFGAHEGGAPRIEAIEGLVPRRLASGGYAAIPKGSVPPTGSTPVRDGTEVAAFLGERLIDPLLPELAGSRAWIFSPDGPLAQLPMELLASRGRRIVETADVHYTQSLSVYRVSRQLQEQHRSSNRPRDLFAMGDPDYGASDSPAAGARRSADPANFPLGSVRWPPLPGTGVEIATLSKLLPGAEVLVGGDASESKLMAANASGSLANFRYLHFAVHGYLNQEAPSLSSLVLSQTRLAPGTDGYVTAAEWASYTLRSDLTVLSACDTGRGQNLAGEGIMGLPFALFVAGNVNTVLSLWPVNDDSTPVFMELFFSKLRAGVPSSAALKQTKTEMMKHRQYSHPTHWAPWVLIGAG